MSKPKKGERWGGRNVGWCKKCPCHDVLWSKHDKILNEEKKEWAK